MVDDILAIVEYCEDFTHPHLIKITSNDVLIGKLVICIDYLSHTPIVTQQLLMLKHLQETD